MNDCNDDMLHLRRKKRFTPRESDYIKFTGEAKNCFCRIYCIPGQTKQQGVPCPCCESTWTTVTGNVTRKDTSNNKWICTAGKCLAAENRSRGNPCLNCPVCKDNKDYTDKLTHECPENGQIVTIASDTTYTYCNVTLHLT
jgi:hypothetical protein